MDRATDEPLSTNVAAQRSPDASEIVDAPGSLPEHRPLRTPVQRTLAAPSARPQAPVVIGKRIEHHAAKNSSDFPTEWLVAITVLAVVIGLMSFFRPEFITRLGGDGSVASSAQTPPESIGTGSGSASASTTGLPLDGPSRVHWGDDFHHYVVTANVTGRSEPEAAAASLPSPELDSVDGPTPVVAADGTVSMRTVPAESLRLVVPTIDEVLALRSLDTAGPLRPLALLDVDGVVGAPMTRYLHLDGRLIDPASVRVTGPRPSEPPVAEPDLVARLAAHEDVAQVTRLAPGLFAVATRARIDDLATEVEGIESVSDDVLLGITTLADSTPQRQRTTRPSPPPTPRIQEGSTPVVAVIDTGFELSSSELSGQWWSNDDTCADGIDDDMNGFVDDCRGWDFGSDDADPSPEVDDPFGDHGTEVATAIAATRNGSGVVGVAEGALIMPLKVTRPTGVVAMSAVAGAIEYAVKNGADVINIALSSQPGVSRREVAALEQAIALAAQAGVVVVTGAGNDSANLLLTPAWPASFASEYRNLIAVGALDPDGAPAGFSNHGSAVAYAAPGVGVPVAGCAAGTVWRSGTSFSAAAVSATVAMVISSGVPRDVDAVLGDLVGRTELINGIYVLDVAPAVDSIGAAPGARAPLDAICRAPGP